MAFESVFLNKSVGALVNGFVAEYVLLYRLCHIPAAVRQRVSRKSEMPEACVSELLTHGVPRPANPKTLKMKIVVNPKYAKLRPFVERLASADFFENNGRVLHEGRNTIKAFETEGVRLAVKSYGGLTLFNRFIYGFLRRSKAERTYLYARRLGSLGIDTPEEVAYVEVRRHGVLWRSYFVSLLSDCTSAAPLTDLRDDARGKLPALDALAAFLYAVHKAGVLHKDLNITNILYRRTDDGGFRFQLIDINRMSFGGRLTPRRRLRNLRRLSCPAPAFLYLLDRYAALSHADTDTVQFRGVVMRLLFDGWQRTRHRLKSLFKRH